MRRCRLDIFHTSPSCGIYAVDYLWRLASGRYLVGGAAQAEKEQEEKVRLPSILLKMQYELKESPDTEPNLVQ